LIGTEKIMWGSDYPHLEGTRPFTNEAIRRTFGGVDPSEVQSMLADTAAEVYGFDHGGTTWSFLVGYRIRFKASLFPGINLE